MELVIVIVLIAVGVIWYFNAQKGKKVAKSEPEAPYKVEAPAPVEVVEAKTEAPAVPAEKPAKTKKPAVKKPKATTDKTTAKKAPKLKRSK